MIRYRKKISSKEFSDENYFQTNLATRYYLLFITVLGYSQPIQRI
jgi:hypothetical protein